MHPFQREQLDALVREKQQVREQAIAILRDLLAELEASPLAGTHTTVRRIKALKVVLEP
jgi:hypothetical protein